MNVQFSIADGLSPGCPVPSADRPDFVDGIGLFYDHNVFGEAHSFVPFSTCRGQAVQNAIGDHRTLSRIILHSKIFRISSKYVHVEKDCPIFIFIVFIAYDLMAVL